MVGGPVGGQLTDGRRFRILKVFYNCKRERLALVADTLRSGGVDRALGSIIA